MEGRHDLEQAFGWKQHAEVDMESVTHIQFAWLHIANVALGLATLGVVVAMIWAMAVDLGHFLRIRRH